MKKEPSVPLTISRNRPLASFRATHGDAGQHGVLGVDDAPSQLTGALLGEDRGRGEKDRPEGDCRNRRASMH